MARFYAGPKNPRTGEQIYPGWARGSEGPAFGWALEEGDPPLSLKEPAFDSLFKWVFGPNWDWRSFDFDHDMAEVDAVLGPDVNGATVGNIDAFKAHGGKLLMYHGWADSIVNPLATIAFYETLAKAPGGQDQLQSSARLFLLPGVEHCGLGGGEGPDAVGSEHGLPAPEVDADHDVLAALAQWVETGTAPEKLIATKYEGDDPTKPDRHAASCLPLSEEGALRRLRRYECSGELRLRIGGIGSRTWARTTATRPGRSPPCGRFGFSPNSSP